MPRHSQSTVEYAFGKRRRITHRVRTAKRGTRAHGYRDAGEDLDQVAIGSELVDRVRLAIRDVDVTLEGRDSVRGLELARLGALAAPGGAAPRPLATALLQRQHEVARAVAGHYEELAVEVRHVGARENLGLIRFELGLWTTRPPEMKKHHPSCPAPPRPRAQISVRCPAI